LLIATSGPVERVVDSVYGKYELLLDGLHSRRASVTGNRWHGLVAGLPPILAAVAGELAAAAGHRRAAAEAASASREKARSRPRAA